jgi:hypothetical protein
MNQPAVGVAATAPRTARVLRSTSKGWADCANFPGFGVLGQQALVLLAYHRVALANALLQAATVDNGNVPARTLDQPELLHLLHSRRHTFARPPSMEAINSCVTPTSLPCMRSRFNSSQRHRRWSMP